MAITKIRGSQIQDGTIYDLQIATTAGIQFSKLEKMPIAQDGSIAFTGDQSMGGHKLTNLADPTNAQDAATKHYVDTYVQGLDAKESVRVATTTNLSATYNNGTSGVGATLTATSNEAIVIDGVTLAQGDRVLVKDQTNAEENGIYVVTTVGDASNPWVLTRAEDNDESDEFASAYTFVEEGTTNHDTGWTCTTDEPITVGTTAINWTQFSGAGSVTAGDGLGQSGNEIYVNAGDGIDIVSDAVAVDVTDIIDTAAGLTEDANNNIQVNLESDGGLQFDTTNGGIEIKLANTSLIVDGTGLRVNPDEVTTYADVVVREVPSGTIDGSNTTFTLANTPVSGTEQVYLNGILQNEGASNDYTISGNTITFNSAPQAGDVILVTYYK